MTILLPGGSAYGSNGSHGYAEEAFVFELVGREE
jgi:hypothetical protein